MKNEIVLYQSDELPEYIEVRLDQDTVWLSLNQIAQLFNRDKSVISRHLSNIYKEGELSKEATVAKNATVQIEAGRKVERNSQWLTKYSENKIFYACHTVSEAGVSKTV